MDVKDTKVTIVGGGLVGALNACFLSKRGYTVDVYERREDIRKQDAVRGRSINLALSQRGREALRAVGLEEYITSSGIPMYARMIHDLDGTRRPIPYGKRDQYIMSVDRRKLNELMLTAAESQKGVNLHFEHKLSCIDGESNTATFERMNDGTTSPVKVRSDLVMGCDGAYSAVRQHLMKNTLFDYSQEYITHGYMELCIPATKEGKFCMEVNYLHIWPRNEYMMIALPNTEDSSFVVTLFMPFSMFESLTTESDLLEFFNAKFPDAVPLIGRDNLVKDFLSSKPLPLVSVKCSPYHHKDKIVILGDAAHAMVPFYGQGMNCGFEDCLIFDSLVDKHNGNWGQILEEYSTFRNPDAEAICDLAMYNYIEMRSSVNSRLFLLRKKIDSWLHWLMPTRWVPLYTMVSFTRIRYHECIKRREWQDKVLQKLVSGAVLLSMMCGVVVTVKMSGLKAGEMANLSEWTNSLHKYLPL